MKSIYETCGKFDHINKTATANTCLPDIANINYNYIEYYNISNNNEYGILGVLVHDGTNEDLRISTSHKVDFLVSQPIELELTNQGFATRSFENLTEDDQIYFFCFHDDEFDISYIQYIVENKLSLADFLQYLQNTKSNPIDYVKMNLPQPKVGNGGILTFNGGC